MYTYDESYTKKYFPMPKAIPYIRFSAIHQGNGSSVDRQEELIADWLEANPDYERFNQSYKDLGKSGYHGDNLKHDMGKIIAAIDGKIIKSGDVILVEAIDRIGRLEAVDFIKIIHTIVDAGVELITLQDNQRYSKRRLNNDSSCLFILIGKIQQAHDYSKSLSKRLSKAWDRKRVKAVAGENVKMATPYWLGSDGKLIAERAEAVKECIDLYLKGRGHRAVLLELMGKYPELESVHPRSLKRWFMHRAMIGEWDHSRAKDESLEVIRGVFEPLIDEATFYKLQRVTKSRTKVMGPEEAYGLSGLVVCSECSSRYHFRRKRTDKGTIVYANCSKYLKRGMCSNKKAIPYEVLEVAFKETYWEYLIDAANEKMADESSQEVTLLKDQLLEHDVRIEKLLDLMLAHPDQGNLEKRFSKLSGDKKSLQRKILAVEGKVTASSFSTEDFNEIYEDLDSDPKHRRDLLKRLQYTIKCLGSSITVKAGPAGIITYNVHKRSQKHSCYLVERTEEEHEIIIEGTDTDGTDYEMSQHPKEVLKYAVRRGEGVIAAVDTNWDYLLEVIEKNGKNMLTKSSMEAVTEGDKCIVH